MPELSLDRVAIFTTSQNLDRVAITTTSMNLVRAANIFINFSTSSIVKRPDFCDGTGVCFWWDYCPFLMGRLSILRVKVGV
jgi:hypothetical protein